MKINPEDGLWTACTTEEFLEMGGVLLNPAAAAPVDKGIPGGWFCYQGDPYCYFPRDENAETLFVKRAGTRAEPVLLVPGKPGRFQPEIRVGDAWIPVRVNDSAPGRIQ